MCPTTEPNLRPVQSPTSIDKLTPRLLFAIRLNESFQPNELSAELLSEWFRMIPLVGVEEVKIEAGFNSFSSVIMVSLPIALYAYIPTDPAIICLGPVTSKNLILQKNQPRQGEIEPSRKETGSVSGSISGSRDGRGVVSANMRRKRVRPFSSSWAKLRTGRSPSRPTKTSSCAGTRTKIVLPKLIAKSEVAGKLAMNLPSNSVSRPEKTALRGIFDKTHLLPSIASNFEKAPIGSVHNPVPETLVQDQTIAVFQQNNDSREEAACQETLSRSSGEPTLTRQPSLNRNQFRDRHASRSNTRTPGSDHDSGGMRKQNIWPLPSADSIKLNNMKTTGRVAPHIRDSAIQVCDLRSFN